MTRRYVDLGNGAVAQVEIADLRHVRDLPNPAVRSIGTVHVDYPNGESVPLADVERPDELVELLARVMVGAADARAAAMGPAADVLDPEDAAVLYAAHTFGAVLLEACRARNARAGDVLRAWEAAALRSLDSSPLAACGMAMMQLLRASVTAAACPCGHPASRAVHTYVGACREGR